MGNAVAAGVIVSENIVAEERAMRKVTRRLKSDKFSFLFRRSNMREEQEKRRLAEDASPVSTSSTLQNTPEQMMEHNDDRSSSSRRPTLEDLMLDTDEEELLTFAGFDNARAGLPCRNVPVVFDVPRRSLFRPITLADDGKEEEGSFGIDPNFRAIQNNFTAKRNRNMTDLVLA